MSFRLAFFILSVVLLNACSSKPKISRDSEGLHQQDGKPNTQVKLKQNDAVEVAEESVDELALQKFLGMDFPREQLGYNEKKFNTCQVGYGFSSVNNCRQLFFVVVNFQLLCRDSEGTVSQAVQSEDLIKNSNRILKWDMKNQNGSVSTDELGYSQVRTIANISQKQQRFKLLLEDNFLYLRAGEVNKIITPRPWCL